MSSESRAQFQADAAAGTVKDPRLYDKHGVKVYPNRRIANADAWSQNVGFGSGDIALSIDVRHAHI